MSDIMDKFSLKNRTALVTGGAGLLGKQFTRALGQAGAQVVVADLDYDLAAAHARDLQAEGILAIGVGVECYQPGFGQRHGCACSRRIRKPGCAGEQRGNGSEV